MKQTYTFREAFALPKEVVQEATPVGTAQLYLESHRPGEEQSGPTDELRLVPTPSKDPADPLNWPQWRKLMTLACVASFSFTGNITSASLTSALPFAAGDFTPVLTTTQLVRTISVCALMLGVANIILVPLANVFGRRPITLLSLALLFSCSMWAATATTYGSFLGARVMQGVGGAATDTLCPTVIGETFFRHQRGRAMVTSSFLGGIIGGYIASSIGWRWTQWLNAIIAGVSLLLCVFFQAETLFDREAAIRNDSAFQTSEGIDSDGNTQEPEKSRTTHYETAITAPRYPEFTYTRSLKFWTYQKGFVSHLIAPWLTFRLPGVFLVTFQYGCLVGSIVTFATIGPQFVSLPPYNWGGGAGLINVGALIGTMIGLLITYEISDWIMKRQAHHQQHGLSEPESRLPAMLQGFFLATGGLLIFGFVGDNPSKNGWVGLEFGYGMLGVALILVPAIGLTYIIEAYGVVASDAFVLQAVIRSIIGFSWTFFVGDWILERGAAEPFGIFGLLMAIFGLLTIPLWMYGKRLRMVTEKWLPKA